MRFQEPTTLLLVDDEELVRQLLARVLRHSGFRVEEANNGASALQAARKLDGSLSLIISDINMPVMDGLEFVGLLRRTDTRVPVLFITASVDPGLIRKAGLQAEVLQKPFTSELFLETVTRMTHASRLEPAAGLVIPIGEGQH